MSIQTDKLEKTDSKNPVRENIKRAVDLNHKVSVTVNIVDHKMKSVIKMLLMMIIVVVATTIMIMLIRIIELV